MKIERVTGRLSLRRTIETGTEEQRRAVQNIIHDVRTHGDTALKMYTEKFDQVTLDSLLVSESEIEAAYKEISAEMLAILREAAANIRDYHERQKRESWMTTKEDGTILGQKITPLDAVGLYVPGGNGSVSVVGLDERHSGTSCGSEADCHRFSAEQARYVASRRISGRS